MPSPEAVAMIESFRKDLRESGIFSRSLEEARRVWDDFSVSVPAYHPEVRIEAVESDGVRGEWVLHPDAAGEQIALHFHGGGFVIGRPPTYRNFNARIAEAGDARVFSVDYRLAPEHRFPTARDDCLAAYRWLLDGGTDAGDIAFLGESAGGGLVMSTLLAAKEAGLPLPASAVAISPWVDLTNSGASQRTRAAEDAMIEDGILEAWSKEYLGGADAGDPAASPLFGDLGGLPPLYLLVGSAERLLDDTRRLFDRLSDADVDTRVEVAAGMPHNWPLFAHTIPEGVAAVTRIGEFLRESWGR